MVTQAVSHAALVPDPALWVQVPVPAPVLHFLAEPTAVLAVFYAAIASSPIVYPYQASKAVVRAFVYVNQV